MLTHGQKAHQYALDVRDGRKPANKYERLACIRHLRDIDRSRDDAAWPFRYDEAKGERVCKFLELLPHVEGSWAENKNALFGPIIRKIWKAGMSAAQVTRRLNELEAETGGEVIAPPWALTESDLRNILDDKPTNKIELEPWQCFITCALFGWVKRGNGRRRFRRASIYEPRKNAKSTWAAGIGLWMFAKDKEPGAKVFCGASSEKQAWKVFGPARMMAEKEPAMRKGLGIQVNARSLIVEKDYCSFEPLIGKPGDGDSVHCAIADEYHQHADNTQLAAMVTGTRSRTQSLVLIISTAGSDLSGPCFSDWKNCEKLLEDVFEDDEKFAIIYTIDDADDWTDPAALAKANPNFGVSIVADDLIADQKRAVREVDFQSDFKTKHLNCWVTAARGWLNLEQWKHCGDESLEMELFAGQNCWVGLDAASKIDLTSMVGTFKTEDGGYRNFARHYIPEDTAALPQNAHYRKWIAEGWLTATPGARIDFTVIETDLKAWSERYNIQQLLFDPRELNDFNNRVALWASFDRVEVPQGPALMSEAMKEMEAGIATGKYKHQCDPVLTWQASNVIKKEARGGGPVKYYYPTKLKPENKIDAIVAGIMALRGAMLANSGGMPGFMFV